MTGKIILRNKNTAISIALPAPCKDVKDAFLESSDALR
jgi:hypothetical protein